MTTHHTAGGSGHDRVAEPEPEPQRTLLVAGLALGFLLAARLHVILPVTSVLVWPLLGLSLRQGLRAGAPLDDTRAALAVWCGFLLTMASLLFTIRDPAMSPMPSPTWPLGHPEWPRGGHPPFGAHPVTARAGLPWPGVEGCPPHCLAMDRIPFDMGVDALLVDCAFWSAVVWLLLRRRSRDDLRVFASWAPWCSPLPIWLGSWQLAVFFD